MLKRRFPGLRFFIVPRELNLVDMIEKRLEGRGNTMRYSVYKQASAGGGLIDEAIEAIIVDTVGDLLGIYKKSMVAFVGGSLAPYGGQNILEPLFFGTPVIFGPYIENFKDIAQIILKNGAGIMVNNADGFFENIGLLMEDDALREKMGREGLNIIEMQKEVMERTVDGITGAVTKK